MSRGQGINKGDGDLVITETVALSFALMGALSDLDDLEHLFETGDNPFSLIFWFP